MKNLYNSINWRYSIGEIIIVSIGIILAFSLGAWNEQMKLSGKKTQYLTSLLADLDEEKDHLEENISIYRTKVDRVNGMLPALYGRSTGRDSTVMAFFSLAELVNYNPPRVTYDVMVNTGDINLISDLDLQKRLVQHYSNQDIVNKSYERISQINQKYFADLMIYDLDYGAIQSGDYSILDKPIVRNLSQSLKASYNIAIRENTTAVEECLELMSTLEKGL
jgi:hypothetical protein